MKPSARIINRLRGRKARKEEEHGKRSSVGRVPAPERADQGRRERLHRGRADAASDEAQGVFVVDASGAEHKVTRRLSVNKPSQLIARVPADVPQGACTVIVRTKYSTSGSGSLKEVREVTYSIRCTAVKA
ncbi:MAG: DUF4469 domain-containing protein [Treponema sp.]|nr:DUF4469 domain-containing protein [Treponema sp.]